MSFPKVRAFRGSIPESMNTYNEYYKRHRASTLAQLNNSSYGKFSFIYSTDFPLFFNEEGDKSSKNTVHFSQ